MNISYDISDFSLPNLSLEKAVFVGSGKHFVIT